MNTNNGEAKGKEELKIPDEFSKVIKDLIKDIKETFPEVIPLINKWWKEISEFDYIDDELERAKAFEESQQAGIKFLFSFCQKKFPPRFFEKRLRTERININGLSFSPNEQILHIFRHPNNFSIPLLNSQKSFSDLSDLVGTVTRLSSEFPKTSQFRWLELMTYVKGDLNNTLDFSSMANSLEVGRRPRIVLMRAYSSSFKPSSANG
jgi:hypothetical protein